MQRPLIAKSQQGRIAGTITVVNYLAAYLAIAAGAATAATRRPRPAFSDGTYHSRHLLSVLQVALIKEYLANVTNEVTLYADQYLVNTQKYLWSQPWGKHPGLHTTTDPPDPLGRYTCGDTGLWHLALASLALATIEHWL